MNIKDIVGNKQKAYFMYYRKGELWYKTDNDFIFPIPINDTGDGQFNATDKAMIFMRYIRLYLEELKNNNP